MTIPSSEESGVLALSFGMMSLSEGDMPKGDMARRWRRRMFQVKRKDAGRGLRAKL